MYLLEEFKESNQKEWEEKIIQDLKGKSIESLIWDSEVGDVNPVLFDTAIECNNPGDFPYTRGQKTFNNNWDIRQQFNSDVSDLNKLILNSLNGGVNAIEILNVSELDFKDVFQNVQLDIIKVYIHVNATNAKIIGESFLEYCKQNNYELESIVGGLIFDPIHELVKKGKLKFDESVIAYLANFSLQLPNMNTFGVDTSLFANSGANIDTQIALAISYGHEYLVQRISSGESIKSISDTMEFKFAIGTSYFLEIAKIRAFRKLWAIIINEYDKGIIDFKIKITGVTANINYSLQDQYNNLLRATTSSMSAVIAGVDSLVVLPFDINESKESYSFGLRLAKNIQLLMQEEAYLNHVIDPSGGSYYIEELTNTISENSWRKFKDIEASGGIMQSIIQGDIQELINKEFETKEQMMKDGSMTMIGVNKFIDENQEIPIENDQESINGGIVEVLKSRRLSSNFE